MFFIPRFGWESQILAIFGIFAMMQPIVSAFSGGQGENPVGDFGGAVTAAARDFATADPTECDPEPDATPEDVTYTPRLTLGMALTLLNFILGLILVMFYVTMDICKKRRRERRRRRTRRTLTPRNVNCGDPTKPGIFGTGLPRIADREKFRKFCLSHQPTDPLFTTGAGFSHVKFATISEFALANPSAKCEGQCELEEIRKICSPVLIDNPTNDPGLMVITVIHTDPSEEGGVTQGKGQPQPPTNMTPALGP